MIDVVMLAVIGVFGALGWKRGLLRTFSELVVVVLALFLASQISDLAARYIVDEVLRPATENAVREQVAAVAAEASRTAREKADGVMESIPNSFIRQHAQALLRDTALPDTLEEAGQEALLSTCLRLTDNVLNTVVYNLVRSLLYAACFAVLNTVLRFAVRTLKAAFRMPVLRQLNQLGGLLLGVGKGLLLAYVCAWILSRAGALTEEMIQGSVLLGLTEALPPGMRV